MDKLQSIPTMLNVKEIILCDMMNLINIGPLILANHLEKVHLEKCPFLSDFRPCANSQKEIIIRNCNWLRNLSFLKERKHQFKTLDLLDISYNKNLVEWFTWPNIIKINKLLLKSD